MEEAPTPVQPSEEGIQHLTQTAVDALGKLEIALAQAAAARRRPPTILAVVGGTVDVLQRDLDRQHRLAA